MNTCYDFKKIGVLFEKPDDMSSPGPYYTSIANMKAIKDFPFTYAMYFSTDHDGGDGGIWLYLCNGDPSVSKNWISYDDAVSNGFFDYVEVKPTGNPIYQEVVQGKGHTETPHVNVVNGRVVLTYHKNSTGHTQATLLATSVDGLNFLRLNGEKDSIVLNYDVTKDVGNGHTGYFRWAPNQFAGIDCQYVGYSLHGGGDDYHSGFWGSDDAVNWKRLSILKPIEGHGVPEDKILIWHEMDPMSIKKVGEDEYVGICAVGNRASGGAKRISELYEVYLAGDGVSLKRDCKPLLLVGEPGQKDSEELASPVLIEGEKNCYLIYVGASESGQLNSVMCAKGAFKKENLSGEPKAASLQSKHVVG